jgi:hypothetical protein
MANGISIHIDWDHHAGGRRGHSRVTALTLVLACLVAAACSGPAPTLPSPEPVQKTLSVSNGTDLVITLTVNGHPVRVIPAQQGAPAIPAADLPPMPWLVEARTATGRVMTSMTVDEADLAAFDVDGFTARPIPASRIDLTCGRLTVWVGLNPPSGPIFGTVHQEPCTP